MPPLPPNLQRHHLLAFLGLIGLLSAIATALSLGHTLLPVALNLLLLLLIAGAALWIWRQPAPAAPPAPVQDELSAIFGDLQDIINALPVAVYCYLLENDERPNLVYISNRIAQLWGISAREAMANPRNFFALIHPEDLPGFIAADRRARATQGIFSHDLRVTLPSGELRWLHLQSVPRRMSGGRIAYNGFIEDITQRKNVEAELLKYQTQLEDLAEQRSADLDRLFHALPDLYFRLAEDGTIVDYRAGCANQLHASPASFLGKRMPDLLPEDEAPALRHAITEAQRLKTLQSIEYRQELPTGEQFYEARLMPADNQHLAVLVRNITDRKKLEASMEASLRDAEHLAQVKGEFLANMSHEIRTPLNGILSLSQTGYRENSGRHVRDTFAKILDAGKLLVGVINDILDFSKIEAGMLHIDTLPVDPGQIASQTVELLQSRAQAKHLKLHVEKSPTLPVACLSDPLRLEQILVNLLSNAIQFTDSGEVVLTLSSSDDQLVLAVRDTGCGIEAAQLERIAAHFAQAATATNHLFGGQGLGLTITHRIVTLMGGSIRVESTAGSGSLFEVRLPCQPVEAAAEPEETAIPETPVAEPNPHADEHRLAGITVLIVEDNPSNQEELEESLFAECATVVTVSNGKDAIERVKHEGANAFDLVLLDTQMPEMDGFETARQLLALAPKLSIVGQTARPKKNDRDKCLASGMVDHLQKPVDLEDLVNTVLRHAKRRHY